MEHQDSVEDRPIMASPMMLVESFLFALTSANKDGRVVMDKQGKQSPYSDWSERSDQFSITATVDPAARHVTCVFVCV